MKKSGQLLFLGGLGGSIYYGIELAYRGFSHWSMFLLGGICMIFISKQGQWCQWKDPLWLQVSRCTLFVMCSEFITGLIVNKWMKWGVWDYSQLRYQIFGQVCLVFTAIFAVLCLLGIGICRLLEKYKIISA